MADIQKAFSNLEKLLKTDKPSWASKSKFWFNCLARIQHSLGANRLFERIANAPQSDIGDYLAELWYATLFKELGYDLIIDPLGDSPDMKISKQGTDIFVEVTCFRNMYPGPPNLTLSDEEEITLVEYGNWKRDTNKSYRKIVDKFSQLDHAEIKSSVLAIWNYDGDLEEIEIQSAIARIGEDRTTKILGIPDSLKFIIFAPWDGNHLTYTIGNPITIAERQLITSISEHSIIELQRQVLIS